MSAQTPTPKHSTDPQAATSSQAPFFAPVVQRQLTVNEPGDEYEKEADQAADQVMRMRNGDAPVVQRMKLTPVGSATQRSMTLQRFSLGDLRLPNLGQLGAGLSSGLSGITSGISGLTSGLSSLTSGLPNLASGLSSLTSNIPGLSGMASSVSGLASGGLGGITSTLGNLASGIPGVGNIASTVSGLASGGLGGITSTLGNLASGIPGVGGIASTVSGLASGGLGGITSTLGNLASGIPGVGGIASTVSGLASGGLGGIAGSLRDVGSNFLGGLFRKEAPGAASPRVAPPSVHQALASGGGAPMDSGTRQFMESRFGQDFSSVRIHVDSQAAESAKDVQARAYTSGKDIAFNTGEYRPETDTGRRLLAHELTHVVQQNGAG